MAQTKRGPGRPKGSKNKSTIEKEKAQSKAKAKAQEIQAKKRADKRVVDEIWAIITIAIGVFFAVATLTNGAGKLGLVIGNGLKGLFGWMAYIVPFYLIAFGILLFARQTSHFSLKTFLLLFVMFIMVCAINSIHFIDVEAINIKWADLGTFYKTGMLITSGGFFGMTIASLLLKWIGVSGCWIFTIVISIICLLLIVNTPLSRFFAKIGEKIEERKLIKQNAHLDYDTEDQSGVQVAMNTNSATSYTPTHEIKIVDSQPDYEPEKAEIKPLTKDKKENLLKFMNDDNLFGETTPSKSGTYGLEEATVVKAGYGMDGIDDEASLLEKKRAEVVTTAECPPVPKLSKEEKTASLSASEINLEGTSKPYKMPPLSLLERPLAGSKMSNSILQNNAEKLEQTLKSFDVDATVVQVTQGPTVTRYELKPAVGVRVSKIESLADDIALNLEAKSIRIEAPIPGKGTVGIEIENPTIRTIKLKEILDSEEFKSHKSKICVALGKDIGGKTIVTDLQSLPHVLIAGSTGSGKSVCINCMIVSLLYKAKPDEVKMILIDPKQGVELGLYNGMPHLMTPVVTDAAGAVRALNWAVGEMTNRYKCFAEVGAKNFESYNDYMRANGEPERVIPNIVIVIDELADLMMVSKAQIEESICRLAQLARAAGIHLVLATQRPSVNVITGIIKANIPSRIGLAVSSQTDSRVILDMNGAEKLVGKGDMLFAPQGNPPTRVQGAFVSEAEIKKVIDYIKAQTDEPVYKDITSAPQEETSVQEGMDLGDDLLPEAIDLVVRAGHASVSMLQRRFRVGYNRAARMIDIMEEKGIVGPQDGARPRQVLISTEQLEEMEKSDN